MEANPLGDLFLPEMNDARKKRVEQPAFMLMVHTKNRAIQMITRLSDPVNGPEIWRRFLEEREPVNRGQYRAMLMQLLQCLLMEGRGRASEEWECAVRQYEAQNLDTLQDTIKAATLAHNPQDSEWCRFVRLSATSLQRYDALKRQTQRQREKQAQRQRERKNNKSKEGTSNTSNTKCSFCKGNDCPKSLRWPAKEKTMSHELCKLTMIDSDASVHVCQVNNGQGDSLRKSSETRPLPGAEMQQRGMRLMGHSNASYAGHETSNLVAGVHGGLRLRCVLREGPMLYCQKQRERT